jgi:hypothetical protein
VTSIIPLTYFFPQKENEKVKIPISFRDCFFSPKTGRGSLTFVSQYYYCTVFNKIMACRRSPMGLWHQDVEMRESSGGVAADLGGVKTHNFPLLTFSLETFFSSPTIASSE